MLAVRPNSEVLSGFLHDRGFLPSTHGFYRNSQYLTQRIQYKLVVCAGKGRHSILNQIKRDLEQPTPTKSNNAKPNPEATSTRVNPTTEGKRPARECTPDTSDVASSKTRERGRTLNSEGLPQNSFEISWNWYWDHQEDWQLRNISLHSIYISNISNIAHSMF